MASICFQSRKVIFHFQRSNFCSQGSAHLNHQLWDRQCTRALHLTLSVEDHIVVVPRSFFRLRLIWPHGDTSGHRAFIWKYSWLQDGALVSLIRAKMLFFLKMLTILTFESLSLAPHLTWNQCALVDHTGSSITRLKGSQEGTQTPHCDQTAILFLLLLYCI